MDQFSMLILDPTAALECKQIPCDKKKGHLYFFFSVPPLLPSLYLSLFLYFFFLFLLSSSLLPFIHFPFLPLFPMSFTSLSFFLSLLPLFKNFIRYSLKFVLLSCKIYIHSITITITLSIFQKPNCQTPNMCVCVYRFIDRHD